MSVKYRVQYKFQAFVWVTEFKCSTYAEAIDWGVNQATYYLEIKHRVQVKVKGGKWRTIAKLKPVVHLREFELEQVD